MFGSSKRKLREAEAQLQETQRDLETQQSAVERLNVSLRDSQKELHAQTEALETSKSAVAARIAELEEALETERAARFAAEGTAADHEDLVTRLRMQLSYERAIDLRHMEAVTAVA